MNKKYKVIEDCNGADGLELKAGEIVRVMTESSINELIAEAKIEDISESA